MDIADLFMTDDEHEKRVLEVTFEDGAYLCSKCGHTTCYRIQRKQKVKCLRCGMTATKTDSSFKCECGHAEAKELSKPPLLLQCANRKCRDQRSITSRTIFHGAKKSLQKCFQMLDQMSQGVIKSAAKMAKDVGVSTTTAYRDSQKIRRIMDDSCVGEEMEEVHPSVFKKVLFRRSTESPPTFGGETLRQYEKRTQAEGPPVSESEENSLVPQAIEFLRKGLQGTSRKQAQNPIAQFNFVMRNSVEESAEILIKLCLQAKRITDKQLARYSSPKMLRVLMPKGKYDQLRKQDLPLICEAPIAWNSSQTAKWGFAVSSVADVAY